MADPDRYRKPHMVGGISVALGVVTPHSVGTRETQEQREPCHNRTLACAAWGTLELGSGRSIARVGSGHA